MKTLSPRSKPKTVLRRGFKAEAERTAIRLRKELGLKDIDPLPAESLADHLGITILTPSDIPGLPLTVINKLMKEGKDMWSGCIFLIEEGIYIIHNPSHAPQRQQSNLMHEIAHALCKHELKGLQSAITDCLVPLREYDQVQELEAECLGACLQLPQPALFYHHHVKKSSSAEIAALFNASQQMVDFRLRISGVLKIRF